MYVRIPINYMSDISIFGTEKLTPETYLLSAVFGYYKEKQNYIRIRTEKVSTLMKEMEKYKDCFVEHTEPIYVTRQGYKYYWEFIPTKEYLIDNQDKLNHAFIVMSLPHRFENGEYVPGVFNPSVRAFEKNKRSELYRNKYKRR